MKLTWLSHSAFRLEVGEAVVLIDPFLSGNPAFKGDVEKVSAGVTHVVVTHGHDDHLGDAAAIAKRTGAQVISNFEICMYLSGEGAQNINPGNTGGTVDCGAFQVSFTQALHSSGITREGRSIYLGNPNGIVIRAAGEPTLFHMGDTDVFGDMALIEEMYQPKIGLVPIGDRFTMGPESAALAVQRFFHFDTVVPIHYDTFPMLTGKPDVFAAALQGSSTKVRIATVGEAMTF
ncbi:MAG: beta-lactamase domain protein [Hyphomicrobiales bacterium]|nr:beta-lactamase domain protein [Hyphomicrobiales bacterium]